jgi:class 3 adenylate cyclase
MGEIQYKTFDEPDEVVNHPNLEGQVVVLGEVERHLDTFHGLAVQAAARILSLAKAGEVWLSASTVALLEGSGMSFMNVGEHGLKCLNGRQQLYRLLS